MKIVICGAGQVGFGIAQRLAEEGHDVSVIDHSSERIHAVGMAIDARAIVGSGASPEILAEAGIEDADMLIAATLHDEVNMVACEVAHTLFSVPTKIARIRSQAYLRPHWQNLFSDDAIPIDFIISPEIEIGETVLRRIALPGAVDIVHFAGDAIVMLGIECEATCPILDMPLREISKRYPGLNATTVGIMRGEEIVIPDAEQRLRAGDIAYVVVQSEKVRRVLEVFGHAEPQAGRIVIAGGGTVGLYVARQIEKRNISARLRVIEPDVDRARLAAERLSRTVVLNGSALDEAILRQADIDEADLLVALTNDDKINLLAGVMARHLGCRSTLTLVNEPSFRALTGPLGIDAFISPQSITISRILQHVRRGRIRAVHSIQNGLAEIIEAEALETSPLVGQPLANLNISHEVRLGAVFRDGRYIQPCATTEIEAGDRVVIFAEAGAVRQVEQMFRVSLEFF